MNRLILLAIILMSSGVFAQTVVVKKVELAGDIIIVHYELDDGNPNNEYQLNLYSIQSFCQHRALFRYLCLLSPFLKA